MVCREHGHGHYRHLAREATTPVPRSSLYRLLHIRIERFPILSLPLFDPSSIHVVAREVHADDKSSRSVDVHGHLSHGAGDYCQLGRLYLCARLG